MNRINSLLDTKTKNSSTINSENNSLKQTLTSRNIETPTKLLSLIINKIINSRIHWVFQTARLIPLRAQRIQQRMKKVIEALYRRQDYQKKWDAFQNIRRLALVSQKRDFLHSKQILKKQRCTAMRLFTVFVVGKKRSIFNRFLSQLRDIGQMRQHQLKTSFRDAFRVLIKIFNRKISGTFSVVKNTRVIIEQNKRLKLMFKIVKEIRTQNMRWAFVQMRRQMLRNRCQKTTEEIKQLDQKLNGYEDQELKGLQDKYKELNQQLQTVKKEKEEIQATLDSQVKQAQNRNKEMKQNLDRMKAKQEEMKAKILEIDQELKTPFSLEEIYQLCYQNLLWTVSQNSQKNYNKEQLLKSLQTPLVPIDLPIEQLKEENQVLRDLLSEYVLMYGQKKLLEGCKLQLTYENLLKQNNLLYKMLMTLLPNAQFLNQQLLRIRQVYEGVQNTVKIYNSK